MLPRYPVTVPYEYASESFGTMLLHNLFVEVHGSTMCTELDVYTITISFWRVD